MTLRRKCAIFFVVLCTMSARPCSGYESVDNNDNEDSDEDKKLKQALVLVDLLKKEYIRAIKENYELRKKETTVIEKSTFSSTDRPPSSTNQLPPILISNTPSKYNDSITLNEQGPWRRRMVHMTEHPSIKKFLGNNNGSKPYPHFYRRRIPFDYYYDTYDYPINSFRRQGALRRNDDENEPETTNPPDSTDASDKTDTTITSDSTIMSNTTDKSSTTDTSDATETLDTTYTSETADAKNNVNFSEPLTEFTITNTMSQQDDIKTSTEDPLQSQVASQLIMELKAGMGAKSTVTKHYNPMNAKHEINKLNYMKLIKTTMKIYLGGSTRIPIPFPENHAFCFTNPRSILCRAYI